MGTYNYPTRFIWLCCSGRQGQGIRVGNCFQNVCVSTIVRGTLPNSDLWLELDYCTHWWSWAGPTQFWQMREREIYLILWLVQLPAQRHQLTCDNETVMLSKTLSPVRETILIQCSNYTLVISSGKITGNLHHQEDYQSVIKTLD